MLDQISTKQIAYSRSLVDKKDAETLLAELNIDPTAKSLDSRQITKIYRNAIFKGVTELGRHWCIFMLPESARFLPSLRGLFIEDGRADLAMFAMEFELSAGTASLPSQLRWPQFVTIFRVGGTPVLSSLEYKVDYDVLDDLRFTLGRSAWSKWLPNARTDDDPWDGDPFRLENSCALFRCLEWATNHKTNDNEDVYAAASELFETVWVPLMGEVMRRARGG